MTPTVTVLLFAGLRQQAGVASLRVPLDGGSTTVAELREQIARRWPELRSGLAQARVAIDQEFARDGDRVHPGQELALIPPVSGGHDGPDPSQMGTTRGQRSTLTSEPLALADVVTAVEHRNAGGVSTFTGNVRERSRGKQVRYLEYEAYPAMAVAKMDAIALAIEAEIEGSTVAIAHRIGRLTIGETAVVIAASAPHRAEAFAACREAIERLKRDVPIWKREVDTEGAEWIGQGP